MQENIIINKEAKYAYKVYKITKQYFYARFVNYPKVEAKGTSKNDLEVNLEDAMKEYLINKK